MITQKLKKMVSDEFALAEKYYAILSEVNDLGLAKREIELAAFTAIRGNISDKKFREEFCTSYGSTISTINNIACRLRKIKVLVRDANRNEIINPVIRLNFLMPLTLNIELSHGS